MLNRLLFAGNPAPPLPQCHMGGGPSLWTLLILIQTKLNTRELLLLFCDFIFNCWKKKSPVILQKMILVGGMQQHNNAG